MRRKDGSEGGREGRSGNDKRQLEFFLMSCRECVWRDVGDIRGTELSKRQVIKGEKGKEGKKGYKEWGGDVKVMGGDSVNYITAN